VSPSPYAGVRLPILLDSLCGEPERWQDADMPFVEPAYNAPFYHAVEYGGIVPYSFTTNPKIHPFVYTANGVEAIVPLPDRGELGRAFRAAQERNNRGKQEEMVLRFGLFGSSKSDIIYYGPAWPRDLLQSRGYVTDYTNGKLWLAQFKGCSGSMEIFPPNLEGIIVEHGWLPFFDFRRKVTVEPEGPRQIAQLAAMACQDAWVRPYLDVDGSGSFSPGDVTCSQSNEAGWIPVPSPQGQVIPCHIVR
jgi:hypothetical protein